MVACKRNRNNSKKRSQRRSNRSYKRHFMKKKYKKRSIKRRGAYKKRLSKNMRGGSSAYRQLGNSGLLSQRSTYPRNLPLTYKVNNTSVSSNVYKVSV